MFLFAVLAQSAGAIRYNPTVHLRGLQARHRLVPDVADDSLLHGPVRGQGVQMDIQDGNGNKSKVWISDLEDNWREGKQDWRLSNPPREAFPPITLSGIDVKTLLHTWMQSVRKGAAMWCLRNPRKDVAAPHVFLVECMLSIMKKMEDDIATLQDTDVTIMPAREHSMEGILQVIGLISKGPMTDAASVKALAVFSQGRIEYDSQGSATSPSPGHPHARALERDQPDSFVKVVESQLGIRVSDDVPNSGKGSVPVFAIHGLVEPELSARAARLLLTKVGHWAQSEQRLVIVARHAVQSSNGTDLTPYYCRLGFVQVKVDDGLSILAYPGTFASKFKSQRMKMEEHQFLVGLDPGKVDFS